MVFMRWRFFGSIFHTILHNNIKFLLYASACLIEVDAGAGTLCLNRICLNSVFSAYLRYVSVNIICNLCSYLSLSTRTY